MKYASLKSGEVWGSSSGISPPLPVCLLTPESAAYPGRHLWYAQPGQIPPASNLPHLKTRWICSVFYQFSHWVAIFTPTVTLEDIIAHIEALTKFTQQALSDS